MTKRNTRNFSQLRQRHPSDWKSRKEWEEQETKLPLSSSLPPSPTSLALRLEAHTRRCGTRRQEKWEVAMSISFVGRQSRGQVLKHSLKPWIEICVWHFAPSFRRLLLRCGDGADKSQSKASPRLKKRQKRIIEAVQQDGFEFCCFLLLCSSKNCCAKQLQSWNLFRDFVSFFHLCFGFNNLRTQHTRFASFSPATQPRYSIWSCGNELNSAAINQRSSSLNSVQVYRLLDGSCQRRGSGKIRNEQLWWRNECDSFDVNDIASFFEEDLVPL